MLLGAIALIATVARGVGGDHDHPVAAEPLPAAIAVPVEEALSSED
jgi:hypothetical protein